MSRSVRQRRALPSSAQERRPGRAAPPPTSSSRTASSQGASAASSARCSWTWAENRRAHDSSCSGPSLWAPSRARTRPIRPSAARSSCAEPFVAAEQVGGSRAEQRPDVAQGLPRAPRSLRPPRAVAGLRCASAWATRPRVFPAPSRARVRRAAPRSSRAAPASARSGSRACCRCRRSRRRPGGAVWRVRVSYQLRNWPQCFSIRSNVSNDLRQPAQQGSEGRCSRSRGPPGSPAGAAPCSWARSGGRPCRRGPPGSCRAGASGRRRRRRSRRSARSGGRSGRSSRRSGSVSGGSATGRGRLTQ